MRYVGNLKKENRDYMNMQDERAVFPPGSVVPDMVAENSVMYNQNRNQNNLQNNQQSNFQNNRIEPELRNNTQVNMQNNTENNMRENREGDMSAMFPLKSDEAFRREEMQMQQRNGVNTNINTYENKSREMTTNKNMTPPMNFNGNMGFVYKSPSAKGCAPSRSVNDFLCEYMGKYISAEFLFGADTYVKKSGILTDMGMNYIVLDVNGSTVICDLTDAKFINISTNDLI